MRHFIVSASFFGSVLLTAACGRPADHVSTVADDPRPLARFGAPELLDVLASTPENSRIPSRPGVSEQQLDAAFASLAGKMRADPTRTRLALEDNFGRSLTPGQKNGFTAIQHGYNKRVQEGAIKIATNSTGAFAVVPVDGRYAARGNGFGGLVFDDHLAEPSADGAEATTEAAGEGPAIRPDHRVGDGRWSWSLSYRWWGVRLSVNHNFLNYLCYNTEWMLSRASLPGWIKIVIRPLGCLVHALDSGADGSNISITWAGVFWYTP